MKTPFGNIEVPSIGGVVLANGSIRLDDGRVIVVEQTWIADADGNRVELLPGDRVHARRL
jgi:hypothetical protein